MDMLLVYLGVSLLINTVLFLVAYAKQSDKLTDISYALTFVVLCSVAFLLNDSTAYSFVLLCMIVLWSVRIGAFLLYRVIKAGKDSRFDDMRSNFFKFGRFWSLQGVTVWLVMLSSLLAFSSDSTAAVVPFGAVVIFLAGLVIETVADLQKLRFASQSANKNKWIQTGLWKYSRHPNYFGEIVVWFGLYIYALPVLNGSDIFIALLSPIFISILLLFVSGVPLLEKSADKRWGHIGDYRKYKNRTSVLIPWLHRNKQ